MRNYARIAIVLCVLVSFFLVSPYIIGRYLQRHYQAMLDVYNATQKISIRLEHFDRGWFSSSATLHVQIVDPTILKYVNLKDQDNTIPSDVFVANQYIQHGPIFYRHILDLPHMFGLVTMHNYMRSTPEVLKLIKIKQDVDYVSFIGSYSKYFELASVNLVYPDSDIQIKAEKLLGHVRILTKENKLQGEINVDGLVLDNPDAQIVIPKVHTEFNVSSNAWLGSYVLKIPTISLIENEIETLNISGFEFNGVSDVSNGMLSGDKDIKMGQMHLNNYLVGPFHFNMSFNRLNAQIIEDMTGAYHDIMARGELYQSQLMQKMLMMLPGIFNPGTTIKLNDFDLNTQDGQLSMTGAAVWNVNTESMPDQFTELLSAADIKINLSMTKSLMDKWIEVASTLPWFNQVNPELEQAYHLARYEMVLTRQLNTYGIMDLVNQGKLKDNTAKLLFNLQKMNMTSHDYTLAVKELLLNKNITRETSHILLYLYTQAQAPIDSILLLMKHNQQKITQDMSMQVASWIKAGYIKQQQNNYEVSFLQQNKRIKINDQWLSE